MRHVRAIIAAILGWAAWSICAATGASASMLHDPVPSSSVRPAHRVAATLLWESVAAGALGALMIAAVVGLVFSLRRSRRSRPSRTSQPALRA